MQIYLDQLMPGTIFSTHGHVFEAGEGIPLIVPTKECEKSGSSVLDWYQGSDDPGTKTVGRECYPKLGGQFQKSQPVYLPMTWEVTVEPDSPRGS